MSIYYQDDAITLLTGDAATVAATLEPQSVQTVVTSPPYFGLRDYGVEGQLGAESSPAAFVAALVAVFEAIRPALTDDGTLWVNLGDSYSAPKTDRAQTNTTTVNGVVVRTARAATPSDARSNGKHSGSDRPAKNLLGIPWRFAFAMQDAGWILRNDIIWAKPNGMPESVTDRLSTKHEHVFLFSARPKYYFDLDAIRSPHSEASIARYATPIRFDHPSADNNGQRGQIDGGHVPERGVNPGDVWNIAMQPFGGAHFATLPPEIPRRCILAGSREGDTVLDPFSGSGTTGMVAGNLGRKYVGIDLNPEYHALALKTRLAQGVLE